MVSLGPELVEVPAGLVGMREREARLALRGVGLTETEVSREYSADVARGEVIWASVREGTMVPTDETRPAHRLGRAAARHGARGDGPRAGDATDALAAEGFDVAREDRFDKQVPVGTVIGTDPGGGEGAMQGATVTIVVSMGPEGTVPDVIGDVRRGRHQPAREGRLHGGRARFRRAVR